MVEAVPAGAQLSMPRAVVRALRPRQWTKNGVLFAPLLFAKSVFREGLFVRSVVAVVAFSLLASGVYLLNDWFDRDKDRLHPEKRFRPVAAGQLGLPSVIALVAVCWAAAFAGALYLGPSFITVVAAYLLMQVAYTLVLKHLVILDVMVIALGFIMRVVAGAVAINVEVSNWLFLCTLLFATFLGLAKRRAEISELADDAAAHRTNLQHYSVPLLDQMMSIAAACTILAYGLYTVSKETVEHVGTDRLKLTVPCVVYGVFRYLYLVHQKGAGGAPEKVLLSDPPLIICIAVYVAVAGWALYG